VGATEGIIRAALLAALAAIAVAFASGSGVSGNHLTDTTTRWAIDANSSGNTAASYGPIDDCVMADAGSDVTIDVIAEDIAAVDDQGTPEPEDDVGGVIGFHLKLTYDEAAFSITGVDADFLLGSNDGSNLYEDTFEIPDNDGEFRFDALDLGVGPGATESGSGVLARITVHVAVAAPAGAHTLNVLDATHYDAQSASLSAPIVYSAVIAVGGPCPGPAMTGDVDCSAAVNAVDGLKVLRYNASLSVAQTEPCSNVGTQSPAVGDVDCSGTTNSVDALKILRFGAGLGYAKIHFCSDMGA